MITGKGIPSRKGNPEGGFARWGTKDKAGNLKPGADQLDVIPPALLVMVNLQVKLQLERKTSTI